MVLLELLVSHHEKSGAWFSWNLERVVFLEQLALISLLIIVVILELLESHHVKAGLSITVAMKSCYLATVAIST